MAFNEIDRAPVLAGGDQRSERNSEQLAIQGQQPALAACSLREAVEPLGIELRSQLGCFWQISTHRVAESHGCGADFRGGVQSSHRDPAARDTDHQGMDRAEIKRKKYLVCL